MVTTAPSMKNEARRLLDQLPDDATWDDLLYQIFVRQTIDVGIQDIRQGRTVPVAEVRKRLGLPAK